MGVSKELISKFLIGNRFHIKLRIFSPKIASKAYGYKVQRLKQLQRKKQTQDNNQNGMVWFNHAFL